MGEVCYVMGMNDDNENMEQLAEIHDPLNENDLDIKRKTVESSLKGYFDHLVEGLEEGNGSSMEVERGQKSTSKMEEEGINDQVKSIEDMNKNQVDEVLVQEEGKVDQEENKWEDEDNTKSEPSIEEHYEVDHNAAILGSEESIN
ncbi:hypothetical protein L1987_37953 [Smallanthus sonchifolius]|uniref:Uncharacterized protein n=1 Tax=Smallanthus sonchifolius TaxID=185202 RepID=A0ACB9HI61_9ASTR|nr:hypothetical protein L1987_37953 [Smallanthus sonchifolius]